MHGTRVVCPVLQPSGESRVEVLDFNVHAARAPTRAEKLAATRLGIDPDRPPEGARLVCEPSVFPAGLVFAKEVVQLRRCRFALCQLRDSASLPSGYYLCLSIYLGPFDPGLR